MSAAHKKVAAALLKIGNKNVPEDRHLVYVNDDEYADLVRRSGPGEPDPDTQIEHFDAGDNENSSGESYGGGFSSNDNPTSANDDNPVDFGGGLTQADIDAAFEAAKNGPEYNEVTGDLGTSGRGGNTGGIASSPTGALSDYAGGNVGQGLGMSVDQAATAYETDPSAWNSANTPTGAGFTFSPGFNSTVGKAVGMIAGPVWGAVAGGLAGSIGYNHGYYSDPNYADGSGLSSEGQGSSDSAGWYNVESTPTEYSLPVVSVTGDMGGVPTFGGYQYGGYVPASGGTTAQAPAASNYGGWQVLGANGGGANPVGGQPYDAVDFLERQKKEAAVKQALLDAPKKGVQTGRAIPTLDDYLAGNY